MIKMLTLPLFGSLGSAKYLHFRNHHTNQGTECFYYPPSSQSSLTPPGDQNSDLGYD